MAEPKKRSHLFQPGESGNLNGRPLSAELKCLRCAEHKPRADFVLDFRTLGTDQEEFTRTCRACTQVLISKPKYEKNALLNIIRDALSKDDYAAARALVDKMIASAVYDGDAQMIKMLLDRIEGPVVQKLEVEGDLTGAMVAQADALRSAIRGQPESLH